MFRNGTQLEKVQTGQVFKNRKSKLSVALTARTVTGGTGQARGKVSFESEDQGTHITGIEPADDGGC